MLREEIARRAPAALWMELVHQPRRLVNEQGATQPLAHLTGCRIAAFCGIGNPGGLYHALQALGYQIEAFRPLTDHCPYHPRDIASLERWVAAQGTLDAVLCTGKDLVKIGRTQLGGVPLWALAIEIDIVRGREGLERRLAAVLDRRRPCGEGR